MDVDSYLPLRRSIRDRCILGLFEAWALRCFMIVSNVVQLLAMQELL